MLVLTYLKRLFSVQKQNEIRNKTFRNRRVGTIGNINQLVMKSQRKSLHVHKQFGNTLKIEGKKSH